MNFKRATIIAKGRVQRVGYRDLIADCAMDLGVFDDMKNLFEFIAI